MQAIARGSWKPPAPSSWWWSSFLLGGDGSAGLNVLSVETFDSLQVPYDQLQPTKTFLGVTDGSTTPIGQVRLPVTFVQRDNYRTELIDFDIAHIRLSYNAILGYPALAKFMAVTHHGYNVLKMP